MHWFTIILIGMASNLDNLGIALAYGVKQTKISIFPNLLIAFISMVITYIAVIAGSTLIDYISPSKANIVGSLLLCGVGVWTLLSNRPSRSKSTKNFKIPSTGQSHNISYKETIFLGFLLSLNCMAGGIGIGANGISAIWTVISIGLFSLLTIGLGSHFGYLLSKSFIGKYSTWISGYLMILIGVYEIFAT
ncbi:manganese efflux pump [Bacillus sp. FJAT-22090]|uniref:manganese efflux pump n=1 Tax=Bacillus sp. FJAT-22090 TaxID=1581038 RepID=UPI0011A6DCAE|nr:manganese efflux pump [Bacillus sp. FJAT-22090]